MENLMHQMKFVLSERTEMQNNYWRLKFSAQYDDTIEEEKKFNEATPWGEFTLSVKAEVAAKYEIGKKYYFYSQLAEK